MTDRDPPARIEIADLLLRLRQAGVTDRRVVAAVESIPRDEFVREQDRDVAYAERALPIDCGQTISAPTLVAIMTAALQTTNEDKVLEVGTGSGYQAAILSRIVSHVYTLDRFRSLVESATKRFQALGLDNVTAAYGDGALGWPDQAPFDRIIVTAAAPEIPEALIDQLKVGGILVAPVGDADGIQRLLRLEKAEEGVIETHLSDVRFVPLIPGRSEQL